MIGTPFSSDICDKCECWPCQCTCKCERLHLDDFPRQNIKDLLKKWKTILEYDESKESNKEQHSKLSKATIIQSHEYWASEVNKNK